MKTSILLFFVVIGTVKSNLYAADLLMAAVRRDDLSSVFRSACSKSVCDRIDFDRKYPHLVDFKNHREQCSGLKNILHWDVVLISINEKHLCHCECK